MFLKVFIVIYFSILFLHSLIQSPHADDFDIWCIFSRLFNFYSEILLVFYWYDTLWILILIGGVSLIIESILELLLNLAV